MIGGRPFGGKSSVMVSSGARSRRWSRPPATARGNRFGQVRGARGEPLVAPERRGLRLRNAH
jgi:hypothetical protein